jgi:5-methylcytosine-specific restriction endonuclease McrA
MPYKDPEKKRAYQAAYRSQWNAAHREHMRAYSRNYYATHSHEILDKQQSTEGRAARAAAKRLWRARNIEKATMIEHVVRRKRRSTLRTSEQHYSTQEWLDLLHACDYRCLACGATSPLVPDHVIPLVKGGGNAIDNIQVLCATCNKRKGIKTTDYRRKAGG